MKILKFLFPIILGVHIQCSEQFIKPTLSREQLKNLIQERLDYKDFIVISADNFIALINMSPSEQNFVTNLANEILNDYYSNTFDGVKIQKFKVLTSEISSSPIYSYGTLKYYLQSNFVYSDADLMDILINELTIEIKNRTSISNSSGMRDLIIPPYIDVCGLTCAVQTENSGIYNTETCYARDIFYSGCYVGCVAHQ